MIASKVDINSGNMKLFVYGVMIIWSVLSVITNAQICRPVAAYDIENACNFKPNLVVQVPRINLTLDEPNCNTILNAKFFNRPPLVKFPQAEAKGTYTLIMVDPDAPNHKKGKFYLHWIVANIPGVEFIKGNIKAGDTIVDYNKPNPPERIHYHRYMFLTFIHKMKHMKFRKITDQSRRIWFDLENWLADNFKLCGPKAGVQFQSRLM